MIPLHVLVANRTVIGVMLVSFAAYGSSAIGLVWLPSYLERTIHMSPAMTGWMLAVIVPLQIPACIAAGWMAERLRPCVTSRAIVCGWIGACSVALGGGAFIGLGIARSAALAVPLTALGLIMVVVTLTVAAPIVAEITPASHRATSLGALTAVYAVGGVAAPSAFGIVVDHGVDLQTGYRLGFSILGSLLLIGAIAAAALIRPVSDRARLLRAGAET